MLMIHEASNIVWGSKVDMRKQADLLEKLEDGIIDTYMTKAKVSREEIRQMVDNETWFSAKEALDIGFATSTATTEEGTNNEDITQLKAQVQAMQNELQQLKNQSNEPTTPASKQYNRKGFIF
jgi:polyhydroxyalkanoate synthesis regulator phasin